MTHHRHLTELKEVQGGADNPTSLSYSDTVHMRGSLYRERALAELAHSDTFFRREPLGWVEEVAEPSGMGGSSVWPGAN